LPVCIYSMFCSLVGSGGKILPPGCTFHVYFILCGTSCKNMVVKRIWSSFAAFQKRH
jgi:hypothetical protein